MLKQTKCLVAVVVAFASVAGAAAASANSAHHGSSHAIRHAHSTQTAQKTAAGQVDGDNVQAGDQTTPDQGASGADQGGSGENKSGVEQSGSELAGNDGPGGHEDEPGNSSADHQFEGEE